MPFTAVAAADIIFYLHHSAADTAPQLAADKEPVISPSVSTAMTDVKMETGYYLL